MVATASQGETRSIEKDAARVAGDRGGPRGSNWTRRRPWSRRRRSRTRSLSRPPSKRRDLEKDGAAGVEGETAH